MQECVGEEATAMVALMPIDLETAKKLCTKAKSMSGKVCEISNINSPTQVRSLIQLFPPY
jgi:malonyl CoA-acyl carrier protein transacylase